MTRLNNDQKQQVELLYKHYKKSNVSSVAIHIGFEELNSKLPPDFLFKRSPSPTTRPSSTFFLAFALAPSGL